jgi:hypothetical protein
MGQGFIRGGSRGELDRASTCVGKTLLPAVRGTDGGRARRVATQGHTPRADRGASAPRSASPRRCCWFAYMQTCSTTWRPRRDFAYTDQIVGMCTPKSALPELRRLKKWLKRRAPAVLQAYVAATSRKLQRAPAIMKADIEALPYPASGSLDSVAQRADRRRRHRRLLPRLCASRREVQDDDDRDEADTLRGFCDTYIRQVGTIYRGLRPLDSQRWPGAICQPFVFGESEVEVDDVSAIEQRVVRHARVAK